jgi:hypothetical protein
MGIRWDVLCELDDDEFYEGWRELARDQVGTWRWGVVERAIVERESDRKCFEVYLNIVTGDEGPGYSRDQEIPLGKEVRPVQVTVTRWEPVER